MQRSDRMKSPSPSFHWFPLFPSWFFWPWFRLRTFLQPGNSASLWPFWDGEFTWPFQWLSHLQPGKKKVTNWITCQVLFLPWCWFWDLHVNVGFVHPPHPDRPSSQSFAHLLLFGGCICSHHHVPFIGNVFGLDFTLQDRLDLFIVCRLPNEGSLELLVTFPQTPWRVSDETWHAVIQGV